MPAPALALALAAAAAHAVWNLLLKGHGDPWVASWLGASAAAALGLGFGGATGAWRPVAGAGWLFIAASASLEVAYFAALSAAYRRSEFSLAYPLARGTVPMWVAMAGALVLRERPTPSGWIGVALVIAGIAILASRGWRGLAGDVRARLREGGTRLALLTSVIVASYTVLNKAAVAVVPPVMYGPIVLGLAAGVIAPVVVARRPDLGTTIRREWGRSLAIGALMISSYLMVLVAMRIAPVTYVSAVREGAIVIGALLGWALFREELGMRRAAGAAVMFAGIVVIAVLG